MSNSWWYEFLIEREPFNRAKVFKILSLMERLGYFPINPVLGDIRVFWVAPDLDFKMGEFGDLDDAVSFLEHPGSIMDLWKDDVVVNLGTDFTGAEEVRQLEALAKVLQKMGRLPDEPHFGKIDLSIEWAYFYGTPADHFTAAEDLRLAFGEIATEFEVPFAYSRDEDVFDSFFPCMHIHRDLYLQQPPSILFWLNYFSNDYLAQIGGAEIFKPLGAQIEPLSKGVLVSFFEHPRDMDLHKLWQINDEWQQMIGIEG